MQLIPINIVRADHKKIAAIDHVINSIYRLILYSRQHTDDDLLDTYMAGIHSLQQQLSIKNAQMEAQTEAEALEYLKNLKRALEFILEEIITQRNFEQEVQLFQLLRLISPEAHALHPNQYRRTQVQVGAHLCPDPYQVPHLVQQLFYQMQQIEHPVIRAIYFHHELIRIHPFADGNGRVTRFAKNWIFLFHLYPPIYIDDAAEKKDYITTLSKSFAALDDSPGVWNEHTDAFFEQELDRLLNNSNLLMQTITNLGINRAD